MLFYVKYDNMKIKYVKKLIKYVKKLIKRKLSKLFVQDARLYKIINFNLLKIALIFRV
jgi:hypothetical protein